MKPDAAFNQQLQEEESNRLAVKVNALTASDKERIYREGIELQQLQNSKQSRFHMWTVQWLTHDHMPYRFVVLALLAVGRHFQTDQAKLRNA